MRNELKNDHTTDTIQKSRMHVFKFLTQLAPSVEKTVNLHGFRYIYKQRTINVLFTQNGP